MSILEFKHNPCEEHLGVETEDNWCPLCLMAERDALKEDITDMREHFSVAAKNMMAQEAEISSLKIRVIQLTDALVDANADAERLAMDLRREQNPGYTCLSLRLHDARANPPTPETRP